MATLRKPFQGVWNIIRFNWHFYVIAMVILFLSFLMARFTEGFVGVAFEFLACALFIVVLTSLFVSWYVYDASGFYQLKWLDNDFCPTDSIANMNAGFDEFSTLLQERFPDTKLHVFDFYDELDKKEISIKRAQKAYPAYVPTIPITFTNLPLEEDSCDVVFLLLAAHEIRSDDIRIQFFKSIRQKIKPGGKIIVVEHLRDRFNFFAYTLGFFHFLSLNKWMETFTGAALTLVSKEKITPFITLFILQKDGTSF